MTSNEAVNVFYLKLAPQFKWSMNFCLCVVQMKVYVCVREQEREGRQKVLRGTECVSTSDMWLGERTPSKSLF